MANALPRLRDKLGSDPAYFKKVYNHTFDFARSEGQRSLGMSSSGFSLSWTYCILGLETAQAFWGLLLPHGLRGGALSHSKSSDDEDVNMDDDEEGWKLEYVQWWFDFLDEKGSKGISKDTWVMVRLVLQSPFDY